MKCMSRSASRHSESILITASRFTWIGYGEEMSAIQIIVPEHYQFQPYCDVLDFKIDTFNLFDRKLERLTSISLKADPVITQDRIIDNSDSLGLVGANAGAFHQIEPMRWSVAS